MTMLGINNYIIITVVNALIDTTKAYFDKASTIKRAAYNSMYDSIGNQHNKEIIQKQAFPVSLVPDVKTAYGITSTKFETHTAYFNGRVLDISSSLKNKTEIILINNNINVEHATILASKQPIMPSRFNPILSKQLGETSPLLPTQPEFVYESTIIDKPIPLWGPGGAGQRGGYSNFGGLAL